MMIEDNATMTGDGAMMVRDRTTMKGTKQQWIGGEVG
jgi:hypothetical protein